MSVFVCLFVVCSGRFVAASVRYLTLLPRFPSTDDDLPLFLYRGFYLSLHFFLLFPSFGIDPRKFTRLRRAGVTSGIFAVFPRSSTIGDTAPSSLFLFLRLSSTIVELHRNCLIRLSREQPVLLKNLINSRHLSPSVRATRCQACFSLSRNFFRTFSAGNSNVTIIRSFTLLLHA